MEDSETPRMHKYGESKTTQIMMATVRQRDCLGGTSEISDRWIFVRRSVPISWVEELCPVVTQLSLGCQMSLAFCKVI